MVAVIIEMDRLGTQKVTRQQEAQERRAASMTTQVDDERAGMCQPPHRRDGGLACILRLVEEPHVEIADVAGQPLDSCEAVVPQSTHLGVLALRGKAFLPIVTDNPHPGDVEKQAEMPVSAHGEQRRVDAFTEYRGGLGENLVFLVSMFAE